MAALGGFRDLRVYQLAYKVAMQIFNETKTFPHDERYSMISQIRRSSRSVAANLAEGYRKRQYPNMFVSKLADCDAEATDAGLAGLCAGLLLSVRRAPQGIDGWL
jgi:23S rRNA-intervening sequence protein